MLVISHVNQCRNRVGHKVYCGRTFGGYQASPLGNPFKADPTEPGATLENYKSWLWKAMQDPQSPQSKELHRIMQLWTKSEGDVILMCWCTDAATCHCSVIRKAVIYLDSQQAKSEKGTPKLTTDTVMGR